MTDQNGIFSVMTVPAEDVPAATAEAVARKHWGLHATALLLTGERDRNFHLTVSDGAQYVLKFANPAEHPAITDFQIQALRHIAATDPGMVVPRIIPLPTGAIEAYPTGTNQRVRLLSWIDGIPLRHAPRSAAQRAACGRISARLGQALRGFTHPASRHELIWDVTHTLRLREVLNALGHPTGEAQVAAVLDAFATHASPALPAMRRQVLHNDMNESNTLLEQTNPDQIAGIIDFGDMVETNLAIDVAVGTTSQLNADTPTADAAAQFVAGYHSVTPLTPQEVELLPLLIAARLCLALVLPIWHRKTHPDNPHYAIATEDQILRRLAAIAAVRSQETANALRGACGQK